MNIENVIKRGLCNGCGTCVGMCPIEAIRMEISNRGFYIPIINDQKCTHCRICNNVCPQSKENNKYENLNVLVFGKIANDNLLGNYINCYIGYSTNKKLRFDSSSGGMIGQLLISALEEGIINGALVTRMKKDKPLEPEPFIARTKEEVIEARGSKYCPVPSNIALKKILNSKEGEKFAVVGLPCQIHGIRKAEQINEKIREKIILHLGLFCSGMKSFFGTEFILERINIKKRAVKNIRYRGNGWPGHMQVEKLCGKLYYLPFKNPLYYGGVFGMLFKNNVCVFCRDFTAELSDISFADAWNIEKKDTIGTSLLISRTNIGEELLSKLSFYSKIKIKNVKRDVIQSQSNIYSKKKLLESYTYHYIKDKISLVINILSTYPYKPIRKYFCSFIYTLVLIKFKIIKLFYRRK